jgi:acyl-CoA thioesterase-1
MSLDETVLGQKIKRRGFLGQLGSVGLASISGVGQSSVPPDSDDNGKDIRALLKGKQPVMWVLTGDSITHGALHTFGWRSYPELFAERVRWELYRVHDIVVNTGISGDTVPGVLKDLDWRVLQFKPQVTSVMMGMNDCVKGTANREDFRSNLNKLLDQLESHQSLPVLHTPNIIYPANDARRGDLPAYAQIIREVAKERKILLVDHHAHWQKKIDAAVNVVGKPDPGALLYWLSDGNVHPNEYGHRELANFFFERLGIFDPTSYTCKLFVP